MAPLLPSSRSIYRKTDDIVLTGNKNLFTETKQDSEIFDNYFVEAVHDLTVAMVPQPTICMVTLVSNQLTETR